MFVLLLHPSRGVAIRATFVATEHFLRNFVRVTVGLEETAVSWYFFGANGGCVL